MSPLISPSRMAFRLEHQELQDFERTSRLEWLEANGLGGWASSTVSGAHTRRYHGLLVAALKPPVDRMVLLSRLDETVHCGPFRFELGCNQFPGTLHPQGFWRLASFTWDMFPVFEYRTGDIAIKKTISALHGENTTLILYEVLCAPGPFTFELQPFIAARDYHTLAHYNQTLDTSWTFKGGVWCACPYQGLPTLYLTVPQAQFESWPNWHYDFEYQREVERGFPWREDLFSPGKFKLTLAAGEKLGVIASAQRPAVGDAFQLFEQEKARRQKLLSGLLRTDEFTCTLTLAADQFIVRRGRNGRTILAGYPWFTDWGRDALVALPGLCLITGRFDDAREILRTFRQNMRDGLMPNRFADAGSEPAYNSADASLWFFIAVDAFLRYEADHQFIKREIFGALLEIIGAYQKGTRFNIHMQRDGLLWCGEDDTPLTWMDAKAGKAAVTLRRGKAVEINALWYNALMIAAELCGRYGNQTARQELFNQARQTEKSFCSLFWNDEAECLFDCIDEKGKDPTVRPNQILALGLPYPLLPEEQSRQVLCMVRNKLFTPFGLRTLDPGHPNYRSYYEGGAEQRDSAYHQGTVWPWLLGAYTMAVSRYGQSQHKDEIAGMFAAFKRHLFDWGLGSISEIFDGAAHHYPRGCPFQAWSVAEVLRAYCEQSQSGAIYKAAANV